MPSRKERYLSKFPTEITVSTHCREIGTCITKNKNPRRRAWLI